MKTSPFFCRSFVLIYLLSCLDVFAIHTNRQVVDPVANYVVIGAFAKQRNAIKFANHASSDLHLMAKYEINPNRNLYYVYSLTTTNREEAIAEAMRLRKETELQDAWVYQGELGAMKTNVSTDINPVSEQPIAITALDEPQEVEEITVEEIVGGGATQDSKETVTTDEEKVEEVIPPAVPEYVDDGLPGKRFIFKLMRLSDRTTVNGNVEVIDQDKLKKIGDFEANRIVKVPELKNKSGKIIAVADVFGYRKQQMQLDYANPKNDSSGVVIDENGNTIVPFELVRLKKGDFAIMYNVFYFRDAAIMRPESKFEVNTLVELMRENPKCVIRLHGHTNGNHAGKIIYWGDGTDDLFSLDGSRVSYGSAKELSGARASAIQAYLISQGIDPSRCSVKAWGGKRGIHDKMSARAHENVRVEIEIVED